VKPKVLFLIGSLGVGGAERFLKSLVLHAAPRGFEAKVVCIAELGLWGEELRSLGIDVVCLNKRQGLDLAILPRLVRVMRAERPQVVNTHLWTADFWGRLAALFAGVPFVAVTEQSIDLWKRWYHKLLDRLLFLGTDLVICVSEEVRSFYARDFGVPAGKLRVIPNAIDLQPFEAARGATGLREELGAGDDFIFICVARLDPAKAHAALIDAARLLVERGCRGFRLALVGDGPLRDELRARSAKGGLTPWVRFLGLRADIPALLSQAQAFVLSSVYEGLPLSILEAMAARLPVIATRVGGTPEIVRPDQNGWLVPPGDAEALAEAMAAVMADPERARRFGGAGRQLVESEYAMERIADRTFALFREGTMNRNGAHR